LTRLPAAWKESAPTWPAPRDGSHHVGHDVNPGDSVALHFHHGLEATYAIQGSMVQFPGKDPMMIETGTQGLNLRDVLHGGYTVVGPLPLKIFAVHIVDKDKPLYDTK
jgi:hypothetical protein